MHLSDEPKRESFLSFSAVALLSSALRRGGGGRGVAFGIAREQKQGEEGNRHSTVEAGMSAARQSLASAGSPRAGRSRRGPQSPLPADMPGGCASPAEPFISCALLQILIASPPAPRRKVHPGGGKKKKASANQQLRQNAITKKKKKASLAFALDK